MNMFKGVSVIDLKTSVMFKPMGKVVVYASGRSAVAKRQFQLRSRSTLKMADLTTFCRDLTLDLI